MGDFVIDTNVWVMVDKDLNDVNTPSELDCIEQCRDWLDAFISCQSSRLILDDSYLILTEYRKDIKRKGIGEDYLNRLEAQPRNRLIEVTIEFDDKGLPKVPDVLYQCDFDLSDRKFVAVALAHNPRPTIVNAVDSDWCEKQDAVQQCGLIVHECCPNCVQETLERKKQRKKNKAQCQSN